MQEAMKIENISYGKNLKQWSNKAFNAGKETEAMKHFIPHSKPIFLKSLSPDCWFLLF